MSPTERALEALRRAETYLADRGEIPDWYVHLGEELRALRSAIRDIGTSALDGLSDATPAEWTRLREERDHYRELALAPSPAPSPWQPPDTAPKDGKPVKLLLESPTAAARRVILCEWDADSEAWWNVNSGETLSDFWTVLAWHPADSTELPANFGEKP